MKKAISIVTALLMLMLACACSSTPTPEEVVTNAIEAVKNVDSAKTSEYWGGEADEEPMTDEDMEMMKLFFQNMTYVINGSEISDDKATVDVTISNIDMQQVMSDTITDMMTELISLMMTDEGADMTEEEQTKLFTDTFVENIGSGEYEMISQDVTINLTLVDGNWIIDETGNDAAFDAMTGGFMTAINSMSEALAGLE